MAPGAALSDDTSGPIVTVFEKIDPRARRAPSRPHGWFAAVGAVLSVLVAAAAKRAGVPEMVAASWVALSAPALFAWLVYVWAPDGGIGRSRRTALVLALYFTSSAAALASIVPGRELGEATLGQPGDGLVVTSSGGRTTIAIAGELPREGSEHIAYELRAGSQRILGALERTTAHIRIARTVQRRRGLHDSEVHDVTLPRGKTSIVLVHVGGEVVGGLRVKVLDSFVPAWASGSLALSAFIAAVWVLAAGSAAAPIAMAAGVSAVFALAMRAMATPDRPFRGSVLALAAAVPLGLVAGVLALAFVREIKRVPQRLRHVSRRRRG